VAEEGGVEGDVRERADKLLSCGQGKKKGLN